MPVSPEGVVCAVLTGGALTVAMIGYYWHVVAKPAAVISVVTVGLVSAALIFGKAVR